jgi:hypothetical protein
MLPPCGWLQQPESFRPLFSFSGGADTQGAPRFSFMMRPEHRQAQHLTLRKAACSLVLVCGLANCSAAISPTSEVPVAAEPGASAAGSYPGLIPEVSAGPPASPPLHITYPAARMDIPVHPFVPDEASVASRSLVPPETMDGYWLATFGSPGAGSTDTTYVVGHSWLGRDAPFNHLSMFARPGDRLTVHTGAGALEYQVDSVTIHTKATLKDSAIWEVVPNSVVLISCFTEDPQGKNVVVLALPSPAELQ